MSQIHVLMFRLACLSRGWRWLKPHVRKNDVDPNNFEFFCYGDTLGLPPPQTKTTPRAMPHRLPVRATG